MPDATPLMLRPASAFAGLAVPNAMPAAGIVVHERDLQLATVIALKGGRAAIAQALQDRFGLALPDGPMRVANGPLAVLGTGPRTWLVQRDGGAPLAAELAGLLGTAAVTDQSDGYAVLRLSGPRLRALLEKGISVDLHERAFPPGSVAATSCAHIGITLWRLDDRGGEPVFEVALFRSLAGSFWHFLASSAAEFGLAVRAASLTAF